MPGICRRLVLILVVASFCVNACDSETSEGCLYNHVLGEIQFSPDNPPASGELEVEVTVTVSLVGSGCQQPLEGANVEIFSSRNTGGETIDIIQQPGEPTNHEGQAVAYLGSDCHGEAHITAAADGAMLCKHWVGSECWSLKETVLFITTCSSNQEICGCGCVDLNVDMNHCGQCGNACREGEQVCEQGECADLDGDGDGYTGVAAGGDDCDDQRADVYPGAPEKCNQLDDDCDGDTDEDYLIGEICDGEGMCGIGLVECFSETTSGCNTDPGGTRDHSYPEECDGLDNDCDGDTDEGFDADIECDDGNLCTEDRCQGVQGCVNIVIVGYPCDDGDECTERDACNEFGLCAGHMVDADGDGHAPQPCGGDCDDQDPDVYPGVVEDSTSRFVCADGKDNDCDGYTDHDEPGCCVPDCTGAVCGDGGCPDQPVVCGECPEGFFCGGGSCEEITDQVVWILVPGGSFWMGSDDGPPMEQPVHQVDVPGFYMTMTEVTVSQYQSCVDTGPCWAPDPCSGSNWGVAGREDHPLNCASWFEASVFCGWIGGRLPSEAEWEYAARGGGLDVVYPWGNDDPSCDFAVYREDTSGCGEGSTWPVCSKPVGKTAQGLYNMAGNVCEMVQDYHHGDYTGAPADGSAWEDPVTSTRSIRGGDYLSGPDSLRTTFRGNSVNPGSGFGMVGFRCARSTAPP